MSSLHTHTNFIFKSFCTGAYKIERLSGKFSFFFDLDQNKAKIFFWLYYKTKTKFRNKVLRTSYLWKFYILFFSLISCILYPVFLYLVSCILYPVSFVLYPVSCILYPVSFIRNPVSCIQNPRFFILIILLHAWVMKLKSKPFFVYLSIWTIFDYNPIDHDPGSWILNPGNRLNPRSSFESFNPRDQKSTLQN